MGEETTSTPETDPTRPMPFGFEQGDTEPLPVDPPVSSPLPPPPPVGMPPASTAPPAPSATMSATSPAPPVDDSSLAKTDIIGSSAPSLSSTAPAAPVAPPSPASTPAPMPSPPAGWAPGSTPTSPPTVARSEPSTPPTNTPGGQATQWFPPSSVERATQSNESNSSRPFSPSAPPNPPRGSAVPKSVADSQSGRWGWRALLAFVVGALMATGAFAAGRFTAPQDEVAATSPTSISLDLDSDTQLAESLERTPIDPSGLEPAAFVAQTLGPSVVQVETDIGLGSGVVYRQGYVMTNNHVIEDAGAVRVRSSDGRTLEATIVGTDEASDIAVLAVAEGSDLPVAELASSNEVQVGQLAIAIGSPFQLQQTVTAGIVSAVNRPVPSRVENIWVAMIQTDAPINPGNSGGALADKDARVIGINTSIQTGGFTNTNAGVGFAVPIDNAARIADLLVAGQPIEPGFLGVQGGPTLNGEAGVEITEVTELSAAEAAGILAGDRVLSIDGAPVTSIQELAGLVLARQAGDAVVLQVVRDGQTIELDVELGLREN